MNSRFKQLLGCDSLKMLKPPLQEAPIAQAINSKRFLNLSGSIARTSQHDIGLVYAGCNLIQHVPVNVISIGTYEW
jgi:hypothetical protein